jgi:hypothetical protein
MSVFLIDDDATAAAIAVAFTGLFKQTAMPAPGSTLSLAAKLPQAQLTSIQSVGRFRGSPSRAIVSKRSRAA